MNTRIQGRAIHRGLVEGEALVMEDCLGGYGAFDVRTGEIVEAGAQRGQSVAGKVVFFRRAKGSSSWTIWHQVLKFTGKAPKAYVVQESNTQVALGAVVLRIPAVEIRGGAAGAVATGDWVRVNGDDGTVEVLRPAGARVPSSTETGAATSATLTAMPVPPER